MMLGCNFKKENCTLKYIDINKKVYNIRGCLKDSLEDGEWLVYDTTNKLLEYGYFDNGLREGPWHYLQSSDSIIVWKKFTSKIGFTTNIPDSLHITEDGSYFVKFKPSSKKKFSMVIALHDLSKENFTVDSFYKIGENEIYERGFSYKYIRNKIISGKTKYYFNWYTLNQGVDDKEQFEVMNIYSVIDQKLVDVTATFANTDENYSRQLFSSVISNFFIDSHRFLNPFSGIDKIENLK